MDIKFKTPILLKELTRNGTCPKGTFSLNAEKWISEFNIQIAGVKNNSTYLDSSGCYCFWFKGNKKELDAYNREHWIKGKQTNLEDLRLSKTCSKIIFTEMRAAAWNAKDQSDKPVYHLYHPVSWNFVEREIGGEMYIPLYVGKSSHLFKRLNLHFSWSNDVEMQETVQVIADHSGDELRLEKETLPRVLKHDKNTVAQFRAGFKFLARSKYAESAPLNLCDRVGITIWTSPFDSIDTRFFDEIDLIAQLRPPFNVDSER